MSFIGMSLAKSAVESRQPRNHKLFKCRRGLFSLSASVTPSGAARVSALFVGPSCWRRGALGLRARAWRTPAHREPVPSEGARDAKRSLATPSANAFWFVATHHPLCHHRTAGSCGHRIGRLVGNARVMRREFCLGGAQRRQDRTLAPHHRRAGPATELGRCDRASAEDRPPALDGAGRADGGSPRPKGIG